MYSKKVDTNHYGKCVPLTKFHYTTDEDFEIDYFLEDFLVIFFGFEIGLTVNFDNLLLSLAALFLWIRLSFAFLSIREDASETVFWVGFFWAFLKAISISEILF